jgi:F420-dependent oxidoreductase-like protein
VSRRDERHVNVATFPAVTIYGVHAGLQHTTMDDLRAFWLRIEELGFGWISVWDHFYAATLSDDPTNHEAVATHAALACDTSRVRCGSLVYCVGYRHPAVLANALCTIDHLSGGRADLGLGAGWSEVEYAAYGMPFPSAKVRLDLLEEAIQCIRGLLRDETTTFHGEHFRLDDARCEPKPVQAELPIWIGGGGEKRTLRIAARWADGWNAAFVDPPTFAHKRQVLHEHCSDVGRDPSELRTSVNVGLAWSEESLRQQFGGLADYVRPGVLGGSDGEVVDRIGEYVEAGVGQVNLALRAPFDVDALERFAAALALPAP